MMPLSEMMRRLRPNILIISTFVFAIALILTGILASLTHRPTADDFVVGALIGLIGTALTAMSSLGRDIVESDRRADRRDENDP